MGDNQGADQGSHRSPKIRRDELRSASSGEEHAALRFPFGIAYPSRLISASFLLGQFERACHCRLAIAKSRRRASTGGPEFPIYAWPSFRFRAFHKARVNSAAVHLLIQYDSYLYGTLAASTLKVLVHFNNDLPELLLVVVKILVRGWTLVDADAMADDF